MLEAEKSVKKFRHHDDIRIQDELLEVMREKFKNHRDHHHGIENHWQVQV